MQKFPTYWAINTLRDAISVIEKETSCDISKLIPAHCVPGEMFPFVFWEFQNWETGETIVVECSAEAFPERESRIVPSKDESFLDACENASM